MVLLEYDLFVGRRTRFEGIQPRQGVVVLVVTDLEIRVVRDQYPLYIYCVTSCSFLYHFDCARWRNEAESFLLRPIRHSLFSRVPAH